MLAVLMVIIGGVALAAGWVFDQQSLLLVALGVSGTGLLQFGAHAWLGRQAASSQAEQAADGYPSPGPESDHRTTFPA